MLTRSVQKNKHKCPIQCSKPTYDIRVPLVLQLYVLAVQTFWSTGRRGLSEAETGDWRRLEPPPARAFPHGMGLHIHRPHPAGARMASNSTPPMTQDCPSVPQVHYGLPIDNRTQTSDHGWHHHLPIRNQHGSAPNVTNKRVIEK